MIVFMQWLHLLAAVVGVGGTILFRIVLLPSLSSLPSEQRAALVARLAPRFRLAIWLAIVILIFSGVFNLLESTHLAEPAYRHVLEVKIVLALALFSIALLATLPLPSLSRIQQRRPALLATNVILGIIIILLSAYLRRF